MKYQRIPYKAEGTKFITRKMPYGGKELTVPVIDFPISSVENFKLSWKRQTPMWAPISLLEIDMISLGKTSRFPELVAKNERFDFCDEWGVEWVYVAEVGGPMLKPGTQFLDDITNWEKDTKFPDWNEAYPFASRADNYYKNRKNPDSVLSIDIGSGGTERLVAMLGGYEQAMIAMAMEPEAVSDFLDAASDNMIERFDAVKKHWPDVNMITFHDDWATERGPFFSEKYLENMVLKSTKKLINHVKASGDIAFEFHCCGNIAMFMPYIVDMGVDILQIQRRANDMPAFKQKYGDKVGFATSLEGVEMGADIPREERLEKVRQTLDIYGKGGGLYLNVGISKDEAAIWDSCYEAYCYSRELYDKERGEI